ncbi:MAG: hypothetical protein QW585_01915 [Candidatus Pacearchaeota archaeon]
MLVDKIIRLAREGYSDAQIIKQLREEGYSPRQISDAFNQAKIKLELNKGLEVPRPEETKTEETEESAEMEPSIASENYESEAGYESETEGSEAAFLPQVEYRASASEVEELVLEVIEEKWQEFRKKTSNLLETMEKVENALKNFEKRLTREEMIIKKLGDAARQKFSEQDREIKMLKAEVHAIKETLNKIMKPLVSKVKEQAGLLEIEKSDEKEKLQGKIDKKTKKKEKTTLDSLFM